MFLNVARRKSNLTSLSYSRYRHFIRTDTCLSIDNEVFDKKMLSFWSKDSGKKDKTYEIIKPNILPKDHAESIQNIVSAIPSHISLPEYAISSIPEKEKKTNNDKLGINTLTVWNEDEIRCIRQSCQIAKEVLSTLSSLISCHSQPTLSNSIIPKYGELNDQKVLTTNDLNDIAHKMIISANAYPSTLNFNGYPKSISTSVNNIAGHGIPDDRPLQTGDMISIDVPVYYNGFHGDCAGTFIFGESNDIDGLHLLNSSKECLFAGIAACAPEAPIRAIGHSISKFSKRRGIKAIPNCCGHGIGKLLYCGETIFHVPNHYLGLMKAGNIFTIEPHITEGLSGIELSGVDGFSVVTRDNSRVAIFGHTILITEYGVDILSL